MVIKLQRGYPTDSTLSQLLQKDADNETNAELVLKNLASVCKTTQHSNQLSSCEEQRSCTGSDNLFLLLPFLIIASYYLYVRLVLIQ